MPPIADEAICIRHWDWSETSQTVALFTRQMGMVRALAKGSKRPKSPYSGGVEMLTRGRIGLIVRPNSELALLTEWDLVESYPGLRRSLPAYNAGLFVADVIQHMVRDHDPHTALYDQTRACLTALGETSASGGPDACARAIALALLKFQWAVLSEAGVAPELYVNVRTGEEVLPGEKSGGAGVFTFNPGLGGFFDDRSESSADAAGWRVRATTLALLRKVARGEGPLEDASTDDLDRANRLLASYIRHVLGSEPPTMGVVFPGRLER